MNRQFYHSEKLQSTKTKDPHFMRDTVFYHSEKLQSTKTNTSIPVCILVVLS